MLLKVLRRALNLAKIPYFNKDYFINYKKNGVFLTENKNFNINFYLKKIREKDLLHEYLYELFFNKKECNYYVKGIEKEVFKELKHKSINGIRLEAGGRLTKTFNRF